MIKKRIEMQEVNKTIDDVVEINELLNEMITLDFESISNEDLITIRTSLNRLECKINGLINIITSEID